MQAHTAGNKPVYGDNFTLAAVVDEDFIKNYEIKTYLPNKSLDKAITINVDAFKANYETDYNQFFRQEHFNAFEGNKPFLNNDIAKSERKVVHERLIDLHKIIYPIIEEKGWDLHPNERKQNITSLYWHSPFNSKELSGIWLYYGKGTEELKDNHRIYNSDLSPIDHIRLQVIVMEKLVGIWCAVGKDNGSKTDRKAFNTKIQTLDNQIKFYNLIKALDEDYFIDVNGNDKTIYVKDIKTYRDLYSLVNADIDHLDKYFIIGIDIIPNDVRIREDNIGKFVIGEFEKLYPIYQFIKVPRNPHA